MSAHDHTTIVPGCYRCDLNKDELPTPLEAAAAVIADGPPAFPSDTTTAREAIEAALDAADLEDLVIETLASAGDRSWALSDGPKLAHRIRTAILGADS